MADKAANAEGRMETNPLRSVAGTARAWRRASWGVALAGSSLLAVGILGCGIAERRERERTDACMSNLHHVAIALRMYAVDNGVYPPPYNPETGEGGVSALVPLYLESLAPLRCPDDPTTPAHYGVAHHTAWDRTKFDRCYSSYNQYFNSWGFDNTGKPMENEAQARSACAGKADDLGRPLWDPGPGAGPSAVFPGLVNRNAPDNTIATRCPWHRTHLDRNSEKDLAVRLDGSVQVLDVRSYDWVTQPRDQSGARTPE